MSEQAYRFAAILPGDIPEKFFDIPRRDLVGMRNVMIHGYCGATFAMGWRAATNDLLKLKERINVIQDSL